MSQIDTLPPLREVIAEHGLQAKKQLGQNFLLDLNLTARIARVAGPLDGVTVIEVGPGPGGLTRALLAEGAKKVIAIERDDRTAPALAQIAAAYPGRLEVIAADALTVDYAKLADGPTRIIANLPYNIATPLLTGWLSAEPWPPYFESLVLMFQREVAERICAKPGEDAYGRLGVLAGWRAEARIAFNVDRNAFTPPPKVTSSVVHLRPKAISDGVAVRDLEAVTKAAFGQRRKMVRQSLKGLGLPVQHFLDTAALKGDERAEDLPIEAFLKMAHVHKHYRALAAARSGAASRDPALQRLILDVVTDRHQKVFRVLMGIYQRDGMTSAQLYDLASCLEAMVEDGLLEATGDVRAWTESEVRRA